MKIQNLTIDTDKTKYAARAWRTEVLRYEANDQIAKIMQAFVPENFHVELIERESDVPGFPHAPRYKFDAYFKDTRRDGSDAHVIVSAYTREGAVAKLLAYILDGRGFFPLT